MLTAMSMFIDASAQRRVHSVSKSAAFLQPPGTKLKDIGT